MERKLLLLGLLRIQGMYGYRLNEVIDSHLGTSIRIKKPTAYSLLNKMAADGWITFREEQDGNRPPRRVYDVTPEGEAAFQKMLRESLADYKTAEFYSDISIAFLDALPVEEAVPLLRKRRAMIVKLSDEAEKYEEHPGSFGFVIDHQLRHLATELDWLDSVIQKLQNTTSDK
jgi:DNA-binding PadR family transcriptional regulator